MSSSSRFLSSNGLISHSSHTPPVSTFLETHPGAYTTTRTHNEASCILFWERHLKRLTNSVRIILNSSPQFLFGPICPETSSLLVTSSALESTIRSLVYDSTNKVLPIAKDSRKVGEELAMTVLVGGNADVPSKTLHFDEEDISRILDVYVHVSSYVPPAFGVQGSGARLALLGKGRITATAKYSDWKLLYDTPLPSVFIVLLLCWIASLMFSLVSRLRKPLEKRRPPSVTELLLSNDGDHLLEGSVTNYFVVCRKDDNQYDINKLDARRSMLGSFEVQTAPLRDGVLPGVIRQLIIEICLSKGIPLKETAPSWSRRELWEEAFVTNGLRIIQHVEIVQVPSAWDLLESKTWNEISWQEKHFKGAPGIITTIIQNEIMRRASSEAFLLNF